MQNKDVTPEEKLLNLIKGNKYVKEQKKENISEQAREEVLEKDTDASLSKKTDKANEGVVLRKKIKKANNPYSVINKVLILVVAISFIVMILGYRFPYKPKNEISKEVDVSRETDTTIKKSPPLNDYTKIVNSRKMFKVFEAPKPREKGPVKPKVTLGQLLAGYTFVGIIFGDDPQAIIEEKRSKQSYYLNAGQYIGDIKIDKIDKGKVTVSYGDETMDIRI